ncbi:hypothetical protein [Spiroplasma endosymbiont of Polydrusus formosus]
MKRFYGLINYLFLNYYWILILGKIKLKAKKRGDYHKKDYSKPKAKLNGNIIIDCIRCEQEFAILNS